MEVAGPLGTPLGLAQRKRASPRWEAGTSGFLCVSDSDRRVPAELGQESDDKKVKERKRLIFLGLRRKPIKPLAQGLPCSRRPQVPSRWGEGTQRLLERFLEARADRKTHV